MIEFDLTELLIVFDEIDPLTKEEQGCYWLNFYRPDNIKIYIAFSKWDKLCSATVEYMGKITCSSSLKKCKSIKVLDEKRKCLEILCGDDDVPVLRVFLSMLGDNILEIENP